MTLNNRNGLKNMKMPRIIALCGNPGSGKSTAAELLQETYGYKIADDGLPLRRIAMEYFGLTEHQVFTQEGKLEQITLNGRTMTVREILGELGNAFEEKFGANIIPIMAHNIMQPDQNYVLGSVRRDQGHYWASMGGLVIEISNPDAGPSMYEFDRYSKSAVHHTILNDGLHEGLHEDDALLRLIDRLAAVLVEQDQKDIAA